MSDNNDSGCLHFDRDHEEYDPKLVESQVWKTFNGSTGRLIYNKVSEEAGEKFDYPDALTLAIDWEKLERIKKGENNATS